MQTEEEQVEWSEVQIAQLITDRDKAQEESRAARTAQANAVADLAEAREHLTKGVLLEARRQARDIGGTDAMAVVDRTAEKFGVRL
ncbi:hypothetical protein ACFWHR_04040 [Leucobacter sp. NPDC058333]|uniref:hypothetical protein n=1 Tax=Leucobacter sp. NPDC058333 TaxID=3346450 RepID=UPI00365B6595